MRHQRPADRVLRLPVPPSGFSGLQLHVLDQLTHCAVVRHGLAGRDHASSQGAPQSARGGSSADRFLSTVLDARYRDCAAQGVAEAADAIIEYVASTPQSARHPS